MTPLIKRLELDREYYFAEGCYINELSNAEHDPAVSIARARVPVGVTTRWHALTGVVERYLIGAGRGLSRYAGTAAGLGRRRGIDSGGLRAAYW